jgi:hypothetical protein
MCACSLLFRQVQYEAMLCPSAMDGYSRVLRVDDGDIAPLRKLLSQ